ncbi:Ribonuclease 3 [Candidatus Zixiibacteriota bacterium]|nr:Ribonuclease 3 [candidate division Zixibacteria bacterium]
MTLNVNWFDFLKRASTEIHQSDEKLADEFYQSMGYLFRDGAYLVKALTHRSLSRSGENSLPSNERLEFLGDAILGMLISQYLFETRPEFDEGDLTKTKALLVNEVALSMVGKECGLNNLIRLSPEEEKSGGRSRNSIISDAVEAVIGAIYLDGGLKAAQDFVRRMIISRTEEIMSLANQRNYKGELLEYLQARGQGAPFYEVIAEEGPDHDKTFKVAVHTNGEITGSGSGASKKEAEQKAAATSLEYLLKKDAETAGK